MTDKENPDRFGANITSLLDTHSNPFIVINKDYTIVAANKAYCDAYGLQAEQVVGSKCHEISHQCNVPCKAHGEECPLESVLQTGERFETLHIHKDHDHSPDHVRIRGYLITDVEGNEYLGEEIIQITHSARSGQDNHSLVGTSDTFLAFLDQAVRAAETDANLLITGESGTGKNLTAGFIHKRSERRDAPFVTLNCATTNENFLGSELFGHERRALPGCTGRRRGLLDDADGGTLYLDEIGDLPLDLQARLLQVLETGQFCRVGGKEVISSKARIIASTNQDLEDMMARKQFREDLYYRLSGIFLDVPPLRKRRDDIPALCEHYLEKYSKVHGRQYSLDNSAKGALATYDYPGNIRELDNILMRAINLATNGNIQGEHIRLRDAPRTSETNGNGSAVNRKDSIRNVEYNHIRQLLEEHQGHRRKVADILQISERTLYRKILKYDLADSGKVKKKD